MNNLTQLLTELLESPDEASITTKDGDQIETGWNSSSARAFGFFRYKFYISARATHFEMFQELSKELTDDTKLKEFAREVLDNSPLPIEAKDEITTWLNNYGNNKELMSGTRKILFSILETNAREIFNSSGRLWKKEKALSFWNSPSKDEVRNVVDELTRMNYDIDPDEWYIDNKKQDGINVTISEFLQNKGVLTPFDKNKLHNASPLLKKYLGK